MENYKDKECRREEEERTGRREKVDRNRRRSKRSNIGRGYTGESRSNKRRKDLKI